MQQRSRRAKIAAMSRRLPNLNAVRAFEAAARHLSFSRAAEELCVTQGAISRHIKSLEAELGVVLFKRLTRAVQLTEQGRFYLPVAREAFDQLEKGTLRLKESANRDVLTVSVLPTFAMRWLIPRLPDFMAASPDIELRMITSIRPVAFERDEVDVAIRVGTTPDAVSDGLGPRIDLNMVQDWKEVRAERFCADILLPVCSPTYLAGRSRPSEPAELLHHQLLHTSTRAHAWTDWFRFFGVPFELKDTSKSFGHFFMTIQAAADGQGVALVPKILVEDELRRGGLVVLYDVAAESSGAYYLLSRKDKWNADRIRRFRDWMLKQRENGLRVTDGQAMADCAHSDEVAGSRANG
jgi:LysR family transcriptional regulator, glycine cleavage system transcriptional activator